MTRASSTEPKRSGNSGRYVKVRNCASENGLSLLTTRPRVARVDAEAREELGDALAAHGRPTIGVDYQLLRADCLLLTRCLDQPLGQVGVLVRATIQPTTYRLHRSRIT